MHCVNQAVEEILIVTNVINYLKKFVKINLQIGNVMKLMKKHG